MGTRHDHHHQQPERSPLVIHDYIAFALNQNPIVFWVAAWIAMSLLFAANRIR